MADRQLDRDARESDRYVDLQLDLCDSETNEWYARFGGRWDKRDKVFAPGKARHGVTLKLHAAQVEGTRWFDDWLSCYIAKDFRGERRIFDVVLYGGRRSGKSFAGWAMAIAFAIANPGAIVFVVVPSESFFGEPTTELEDLIPKSWAAMYGDPATWHFVNGSTISIRSGHIPRLLKQGRVDLVIIHEGQALIKQSYDTISASVIDSGGLVITTCNPPTTGDHDWVADVVTECERGERVHAKTWFLDPELNPVIDHEALHAMREKLSQHDYDTQIRGQILLTPDSVLHAWSRKENERPMPALGECTVPFAKYVEGNSYDFDNLVSIDVQSYPWLVGTRWKAFRNPLAADDMSQALLWCVGEVFIEKGDEIDLGSALIEQGCDTQRTLVVMDASCDWQQAERNEDKQRTVFRGKGSMDMIRSLGFRHVVPPDQNMRANPDIADRCRAANALICTSSGSRRVFADPRLAPRTVESIRKWKTLPNGRPSRSAKAAHAGDTISYLIWRCFPRRAEINKIEIRTKFGQKRFEGRDRTRGW